MSSPYSCIVLSRMLVPTKPSCSALYLTSTRYSYYIPPNSRHWCLLLLSPLGASTIKQILATSQSRHPTWLWTHFYDVTISTNPHHITTSTSTHRRNELQSSKQRLRQCQRQQLHQHRPSLHPLLQPHIHQINLNINHQAQTNRPLPRPRSRSRRTPPSPPGP